MLDQTPGGLQFTRGKLTHIAGLPSLMFRPPGKAATLDESPPFEVQPVDIVRASTVLNDGHTAVRIHRQESRCIEPAEPATGIDMLVFKSQFADQPHDLLDIE